jgi:hypothetical protein
MGVAYMLGGSLTQTINSVEGQSVAVIPAMVWAVDRVCRLATWRAAGTAALVLATAALSSFLPIVASGYLTVGLFVFVNFTWQAVKPDANEDRFSWREWIKPAAAVVVSILLIAFLLLPVHMAGRQDAVFSKWYPGAGSMHYAIDRLLTLLSPSVSFDVNQNFTAFTTQLFKSNSETSMFYVGLIPVLLCSLGFPKTDPKLRKLYACFLGVALFLLLKLLGVAPPQWIAYLPVFRDIHFIPYFCGALNFGIAGVAGLGVEKLVRERSANLLMAGIMACALVFVAILRFAQTQPVNPLLQGATLWSAAAHYGLEIARLLLLAGAFLAILALRRSLTGGAAAGLIVLLVFLDLAPIGLRSRFLRSDVWTDPPNYVKFLQSDHSVFRIHATRDLALDPDTSQGFGLHVLSSREPFNSTRYTNILTKYYGTPFIPYPLAKFLIPSARPLLDILNVKYLTLLSPSAQELQQVSSAGGLVPVFQDGLFQVFQNKTVWDRAYLASGIRVATSPKQGLNALADLRPGDVVMEKPPPGDVSTAGPPGTVEGIQYDFDRIALRVRATRPAILVLDENYSPGWRATVQGKSTEIFHANYAFQSVIVPQGDSEVQFRYVSPGLYAGLGLTALGALLVGAMILAPIAAKIYTSSAAKGVLKSSPSAL